MRRKNQNLLKMTEAGRRFSRFSLEMTFATAAQTQLQEPQSPLQLQPAEVQWMGVTSPTV